MTDAEYIEKAKRQYAEEGAIEIDSNATASRSKGGASLTTGVSQFRGGNMCEAEISAFEKWQREVDSHLERMVGMGSSDLPDYDYAGEFEMGCKPRAVARRAIRAAGGF